MSLYGICLTWAVRKPRILLMFNAQGMVQSLSLSNGVQSPWRRILFFQSKRTPSVTLTSKFLSLDDAPGTCIKERTIMEYRTVVWMIDCETAHARAPWKVSRFLIDFSQRCSLNLNFPSKSCAAEHYFRACHSPQGEAHQCSRLFIKFDSLCITKATEVWCAGASVAPNAMWCHVCIRYIHSRRKTKKVTENKRIRNVTENCSIKRANRQGSWRK